MRENRIRRALVCAGFLVALIALPGLVATAHAVDVKGLLKDVNKELRQAQRDMFGGKAEKAVASLPGIEKKLAEAKAADPNNPQVASYEKKYEKLVKDLERRTGKDLGGGSITAAGSSAGLDLPPKPEAAPMPEKKAASTVPAKSDAGAPAASEAAPTKTAPKKAAADAKLPYNARRPAQMAGQDLDGIEGSLGKLGAPNWNQDQLLDNMKRRLESARKNLESSKAEAAKKGVNTHPDFDALETRIQQAEQKIAGAVSGVAEAKKEAAASASEVTADVDALKAVYDKVEPVLQKATGSVIYYNDLRPAEALIEEIEQFEKSDLAGVKEAMATFGGKYGTTEDAIDEKAKSMGYENSYYRASFAYTELEKGIANVAKTRTVMADDLVRRAEEMKTHTAKGIHDFARLEQHGRIRAWGEMAARYDADNPRVKAFNDGVDAWVKADAKALYDKIDKASFPKQAADAPKDAKKLAKEAVAFLQKEEEKLAAEKGKEVSQVLAVVVTGPWRVFKKNILGEPIQYNLPIATAVQTKSEKGKDLARVYLSTMLTQEMKGVKMAPPYLGATVGDSYYIRPSAIK